MSTRRSGFAIGAVLLVSVASAGVNTFTLTGPDGGYVHAIAVQPGHPEVVVASTTHGLYRSTDAGASWIDLDTRSLASPTVLAFAPGAPNRLYGGALRLMVSTDAGLTFTNTNTPNPARDLLAVVGTRVYTASYAGDILRSDDGMQTWNTLTVPWPTGGSAGVLYSIAADPSNANVLYACAIGRGLYKTIDGGTTWIVPPAGSPCSRTYEWTRQFAVSPGDPNRVIVPTTEGFFVSTDGGTSWTSLGTMGLVPWVSFDPAAPNNVLTMQYGGLIMRSTDGGLNWASQGASTVKLDQRTPPAWTGVAGHFYLPTADGPLFTDDNGATFTLRVSGMHAASVPQIAAANDGTIYAAHSEGSRGVYRRDTTGWTSLDTAGLLARKLNPFAIYDLAVAPGDSSRIYVADLSDGLYRSVNGGVSWLGPSPPQSSVVDAVIVDPSNPSWAYGMTYQGLKRTFDGGTSFSASCGTLPGSTAEFIRVDRNSPVTLYVGGASPPNVRLFKSTNGCATFTPITPQFTFLNDLAIDPVDGQRLFLGHVQGVERSADGGATWQPVHFNLPQGDALPGFRVLIDPVQRSTLWVASASTIGVLRSVDDGATWQRLPMPAEGTGTYLESGVLDPQATDTLLLGASNWGILEYQAAADLGITVTAATGIQRVGSAASATLHVTNKGPLDASPAEVTLPLQGLAVTAPAGCTTATGTLRCLLPPLHVDETHDIPLTLSLGSAPGRKDLTAEVTGHERDTVSANNAATWSMTTDLFADLSLELGPPTGTPLAGTSFQCTLTARNAGPDAVATSVDITITGGTLNQVNASSGGCALAINGAHCVVPLLGSGTPAVLTLTLSAAAAGTVIVDSTVAFTGQEANAANNHATGTVTVQAPPPPPSPPATPPASPPPKKGGGGGSFDWLALALLGGLLVGAGRGLSSRRAIPA